MELEDLKARIYELTQELRKVLEKIESLERKVEVCQTEIKILKEGGNI